MAIRRRKLHPDARLQLPTGQSIDVVSDEQYLEALLDLGRWQCFAGGVITAVVRRQPTDLEGEAVTVGGVLEWKDRTDAKAQPEPVVPLQQEMQELRQERREVAEETLEVLDGHQEAPDRVDTEPEMPAVPQSALAQTGSAQQSVGGSPADEALAEVDRALNGAGAGALPFQRGDEAPAPPPPPPDAVPITAQIAHEDGSSYRPTEPPRGYAHAEVQDGLVVLDEDAVDESEVPEHLR